MCEDPGLCVVPDDKGQEDDGTTYYYYISYDETKDDFYGLVDNGPKATDQVFSIDTTQEMVDLIKTGIMKHIDDVEGLEKFLKLQGFLKKNDILLLSEKLIF